MVYFYSIYSITLFSSQEVSKVEQKGRRCCQKLKFDTFKTV